jgi:hypothetical protein
MSDIPSIVITPSTEVSSEPPPLPPRTATVKITPTEPASTTNVTITPTETSSEPQRKATVTVSPEEPKDDGGWLWVLIMAVLTLVTLGLIFQIIIKLISKPDSNIATSSIIILVSICLIGIGWLARSKSYKIVAIITPLLSAVILSIYNFMV